MIDRTQVSSCGSSYHATGLASDIDPDAELHVTQNAGTDQYSFLTPSITITVHSVTFDCVGNGSERDESQTVPSRVEITDTLEDGVLEGSQDFGPASGEFTWRLTQTPPTSADLSLTKTDSRDPVVVGAKLSYNLTIQNAGPDTAPGVTLTDQLPAGVTFEGYTHAGPAACTESAGMVSCDLFDIAVGQIAEIEITVIPTQGGTITNSASVRSQASDPDMTDNADTEQTTVQAPVSPPIGECFTYPDFSPPSGLNLLGSAAPSGDALRLTPNQGGQSGQAWYGSEVLVDDGFSTEFRFQFTGHGGNGADGITFAVQNSGVEATGGAGGLLGYDGIPSSLVVEFDTFDNFPEFGDPTATTLRCTAAVPNQMGQAVKSSPHRPIQRPSLRLHASAQPKMWRP